MEFKDKQLLYNQFLLKWGDQFKKIPFILNYLSTYPITLKKIEDFVLLKVEELDDYQLEWISLIAKQERPLESDFFKEYWVPIQSNQYSYFIDISSNSFTLFEIKFFHHEPYRWFKNIIYKEITHFFLDIDNPDFNFKEYLEFVDEESWSQKEKFFNERDRLGLEGKIKLDPITKESIIAKHQKGDYILTRRGITFTGINSLIVGLFPLDTEIILEEFKAPFNRNKKVCETVNNIRALVYLLQSVGMLSIDYFSFKFGEENQYRGEFKNLEFIVQTYNVEIRKELIKKFQNL